jgi:hypothetical protein
MGSHVLVSEKIDLNYYTLYFDKNSNGYLIVDPGEKDRIITFMEKRFDLSLINEYAQVKGLRLLINPVIHSSENFSDTLTNFRIKDLVLP